MEGEVPTWSAGTCRVSALATAYGRAGSEPEPACQTDPQSLRANRQALSTATKLNSIVADLNGDIINDQAFSNIAQYAR